MPLFQNTSSRRRRIALVQNLPQFFGVGVVVLSLLVGIAALLFPAAVTHISAPVLRTGTGFTSVMQDISGAFSNAGALTRERDVLREENLALAEENRTLRAFLADQQGFGKDTGRIRAGVVARPPVAPYDTLVVGAGRISGVTAGTYVYGPGGVPLGTVDAVTDDTARIALYSTGGRSTLGWAGEARIPVTLTGRGGGAFAATLPRESGVVVNDVVYVPGPGALPIGTVVRIDSDPSSPRDTVFIAPYANLFSLTWVEIAR